MAFLQTVERELLARDRLLVKCELALAHALGELPGGCFARVVSSDRDKQAIAILKEVRAHNVDPS